MRSHVALLRNITHAFEKQFAYLGIRISVRKFMLNILVFALIASFVAGFVVLLALGWPWYAALVSFIVSFALVIGGVYLVLDLQAEGKGKQVEKVLPDALQLVASNIKSGLTTERALLMSARPEFGPLETELKRVSARVLSGVPIEKAILEISQRIKSTTVERTMWLLARGISSGGEIADLLMQLSRNLRNQFSLENEAHASISIYIILIFFSASFGGPALYAISSFIVAVMSAQIGTQQPVDPSLLAQAGSRFSGLSSFVGSSSTLISPEFVLFFAQIMLLVGGIFASLILGAIATGKEKDGVKYIPVVLFFSFGLFYLIRVVLDVAFGPLLLGG